VKTALGTTAVIPKNAPPELKEALTDSTYRLPPLPTVTDQTTKEQAVQVANENAESAKALKKSAGDVFDAAQRALQNFKAAKSIMDAPDTGPITGQRGELMQKLSQYGFTTDTADNRAEVVKDLTNAAIANLKTTYGERPGIFDLKVNLEQAFPDIKTQGPGAVKELIAQNIRATSFDMATAQRVPAYINAGLDPDEFRTWNGTHFDRAAAINRAPTRPGQETNGTQAQAPVPVKSRAEAMALAPGTVFVTPDGRQLVR
jgi:hypothetical protein